MMGRFSLGVLTPIALKWHWHHNRHRMGDDQADDYLGCGYRGRWPHAINRLELRQELLQRTHSPLTAAKKK